MKRTRHTPEQVIRKLREADAMPAASRSVAEVVQALGVSERAFHRWRNRYDDLVDAVGAAWRSLTGKRLRSVCRCDCIENTRAAYHDAYCSRVGALALAAARRR